jgi:hypothetical protein
MIEASFIPLGTAVQFHLLFGTEGNQIIDSISPAETLQQSNATVMATLPSGNNIEACTGWP